MLRRMFLRKDKTINGDICFRDFYLSIHHRLIEESDYFSQAQRKNNNPFSPPIILFTGVHTVKFL